MSIQVHVYSNGKTMEEQNVTFEEAMFLVEHQDTIAEEPDNFLGFTAPEDEDAVLQFVREEEDKWVVDIPVIEENNYVGSYVTVANHSKVVAMITHFFLKESVLRQSIINNEMDKLEKELASRWGLGIHLIQPKD